MPTEQISESTTVQEHINELNIFSAVRSGDLERVRYLVEVRATPVHQFDDWDASPLYYASFCGHEEIIRYLFTQGARCEQRTFDGERCLYAALNDTVQRLLQSEGFKHAGARGHDLFLDFIQKLFNDVDSFPDIIISLPDGPISVHRFLLRARLPKLGRQLVGGWQEKQASALPDGHVSDAEVLLTLLRWCYTGRLAIHTHLVPVCVAACRALAEEALGKALQLASEGEGAGQGLVAVEAPRERDHIFGCHRSVMCARSEYFATMLQGGFAEGRQQGDQIAVSLDDVDPALMAIALRWAYTDKVNSDAEPSTLLQTMQLGDRLMMEGLKQRCALLLNPYVTQESALPLLQEALAMDAPRLVEACLRCLALHLLQLIEDERLSALITASAETVAARQETDSVPLVDDLRFWVDKLHPSASDDEEEIDEEGNLICRAVAFEHLSEREQKLLVLEDLLNKLDIEA
ncbi:hypothetical protein WJX73_007493 [Symbiochloris irregularis]|uniref:BTB domain-containing protein n=1 Tax=Symbiochloris irregularis TaxID=706552 RepID=A0AAW1NWJ6_9CHLO